MSKARDLTGKTFNRLVVLELSHIKSRRRYWRCLCSCGNKTVVEGYGLTSGRTKSCGCYMREKVAENGKNRTIDITNDKYGRLTALEKADSIKGRTRWKCKCECGNITIVELGSLRNGNTKSCGCYHADLVTTHGKSDTTEYESWRAMISRCENPNDMAYSNYGGRGIKVSSEWRNDFSSFVSDLGGKPTPNHTLDRIDVNGNYDKENCRWADYTTQARNKRKQNASNVSVTGVSWSNHHGRYRAYINSEAGKFKHLGYYMTLKEAEQARKQAELKYWGKASD